MKVKIASIKEKLSEVTVYNFAVKDDESYILNGIVSHNCRCTLAPAASSDKELLNDLSNYGDWTADKKDFDEWLNQ